MNTTIIAWALASAAPESQPPFEVADVEVSFREQTTTIIGYDSDGSVAAKISLWTDDHDRARLTAAFSDGLYLVAISDGDGATVDSPDAAEVARRVAAMDTSLESITDTDVMLCAGSVLAAVGGCTLGGPWGCMGTIGLAGATCGPLFAEAIQ